MVIDAPARLATLRRMRRPLAALVAAAVMLVLAGAAEAVPPPGRGHTPAVVVTEVDHGTAILTNQLNPCTQALDLTLAFSGTSGVHITETVAGGAVLQAHVIVHEVGTFTATLGGTTYTGRVNYLSVVNLNAQNSTALVRDSLRATSPSGAALDLLLVRSVTFAANDPTDPVSSVTHVSAVGCPTTAAATQPAPVGRTHSRAQ